MKIALIQMNVEAGKCESNYQKMVEYIKEAKLASIDMIVFPANVLSGYYLGDEWLNHEFCELVDSYNQKIIDLSEEIAIVWGNIRYRHHQRFNCAFFAYQKETRMSVKKNEHQAMAESRYFNEMSIESEIEYKGHLFNLMFDGKTVNDVTNILLGHHHYIQENKRIYKDDVLYVNPIGIQNTGSNIFVFNGGTATYLQGQLASRANDLQEEMHLVELGKEGMFGKQASLLHTIVFAMKEFDRQMFGMKLPWIIGLSGGLDSAVNAALLSLAIGHERIIAYNMATRYNSDLTKMNATHLAKALNLTLKNGSIEKLNEATLQVVSEYGYSSEGWNSLVTENIQARLRGHLLSTFASIHGGVVINNGNKVEVALGYCTLYGDAIGAMAPIGDCLKTDLFTLSEEINEYYGKEIIPTSLLPTIKDEKLEWEMPPSAELKDNQSDPMKWYYHDLLLKRYLEGMSVETYLQSYLDQSIYQSEFGKWIEYYGLQEPELFVKDIEFFFNTLQRNSFKRIQSPPILVVSNKAFGCDFIEVQGTFDTPLKKSLIQSILEMKRG